MSKEAVGYIGLGHMGSGMVRNLLANGWPVVVHDQRTQAVQAMVKEGATAAGSAREVAESCRVVLSSLPDPAAVDGTEAEKRLAFAETYRMLRNRISIFVNLPLHTLDAFALQRHLDQIGAAEPALEDDGTPA